VVVAWVGVVVGVGVAVVGGCGCRWRWCRVVRLVRAVVAADGMVVLVV